MIDLLVQASASPMSTNRWKVTPLHMAAFAGRTEAIRALVDSPPRATRQGCLRAPANPPASPLLR